MTAPLLLATLRERGAHFTVRESKEGAAVLVISPCGVVGNLAGDVARFKPSLLELLEADHKEERAVFDAGADFRAWHWRAVGAPWSVGFYCDWPQFARVHCARSGGASSLCGDDVASIKRAIFADEWRDLARRVAHHLTGHDLNSSALETWALSTLESETTP